jgi:hypothetical protein
VLTALFRCPSSTLDITDESPKICKSYLQLRDQATPYVQPYYDSYLKPYVDRAQPHVDSLNQKVITPATTFAKEKYDVYGAPRVAQLQDYAEGTWSSTIKPRVEVRRKWARSHYEKQLEPYVNHARSTADPYLREAYNELTDMYDTTVIPLYHRAVPYLQEAYQQGHHITADIIFPTVQHAQQTSFEFLRRQLWPTLVVLYGENVEPQLSKIMERLGRYKDSRKLQAAVKEVDNSSSLGYETAQASSAASSIASSATPTPVKAQSRGQSPSSKASSPEPEKVQTSEPPVKAVDTREKIESDLSNWKEKFAVAADKGAVDLRLRVGEITSRQIENQAQGVGKALVVQLEETAKTKIETLKEDIVEVVKALPENADQETEDAAYEKVVQQVRNAGSAIKEKAQAIRDWEQNYDADTTALVDAALESTLKIVDNIRDLGLQQIGMRWANIESVTYEDWSSYHDLKSEFDAWRFGVEDAALKHEGLEEARREGDHVREAAMKEAQIAVAELVRLREASKWKIATKDSTDDFATKALPPKVKKVAQSVIDKAKSAMGSSSKPSPSLLSKASEGLDGASEDLSDAVNAATSSIAELFDDGLSSAGRLASAASSTILDATESMKPGAKSAASSVSPIVGEATKSLKPSAGTVLSAAKKKTEHLSSAIIGTPAPPPSSESLLSEASSNIGSVSSAVADKATTASNKVFGGAMAAQVEAKQIILDHDFDDDTIYDKIQSMISAAGGKGADLSDAVNEALKGLTATPTQGTVESVTSVAGDKISAAIAAASSVLYGTTPGVVESASSVAADKYAQAVTAYVCP